METALFSQALQRFKPFCNNAGFYNQTVYIYIRRCQALSEKLGMEHLHLYMIRSNIIKVFALWLIIGPIVLPLNLFYTFVLSYLPAPWAFRVLTPRLPISVF